jgi:DNA-binding transcriptional regulator YiaG
MRIAEEVRALRAVLEEDTTTFAARWFKSRRTIEDWEQGRRQPEPFVLANIRQLAARAYAKKTKAKAAVRRAKVQANEDAD